MTSCLIKNLLPDAKEPLGNNGLEFPWEGFCPAPDAIPAYFCELLDEVDGEPILTMEGQPILVECLIPPIVGPTPTPTPFIETNRVVVTAYYSSCPTQVEYSVAASFDVDDDIDLCFENIIGTKTTAPLLTSVCMRINKDTAIGYIQIPIMMQFLELDSTSSFQNIFITPATASSFTYPITFYSVFEVPGCYVGVESGTPGFTVADSIQCNDRVLLEENTTGITSFDIDITCA